MLELHFSHGRNAFPVAVDLKIDKPVMGVFGPSGAGKSTLLHAIAGLIRPERGRIMLDDTLLFDSERRIWVPPHKRRIGMVFQEPRLFPHYTVAGNLQYGQKLQPVDVTPVSFAEVVSLLELSPLLDRKPAQLSGGERQRVALGRAMLCAPRLLLLDEPMAALDRGLKRQILPYLRRVYETLRVPMFYVSHDLSEILQITNQLMVMDQGGIVAKGSLLEVVRQPKALALLHDLGLPNVMKLEIERHEPEAGMTVYRPLGLTEPLIKGCLSRAEPGALVYGLLKPEAIALTLTEVTGISMQNQIPVKLDAIIEAGERVLCVVNAGIRLLVEITPHALRQLALREGGEVRVVFKAQSLVSLD